MIFITSVKEEIKRPNLPIHETEIDRAHRLGAPLIDIVHCCNYSDSLFYFEI